MYYFACDYHEGAAPEVLEALIKTNTVQTPGYGTDRFSKKAKQTVAKELGENFHGEIHFVVGGTQANVTVIAAALRPYEGVICADTGHIHVHETGAVEAAGHKCLAVASDSQGKILPSEVRRVLEVHFSADENVHETMPRMVYISNTTEKGGVYTAKELQALREICDCYGQLLFIDGSRLGYALTSEDSDITLADLTKYADVFTIGGTKQGALFGECIVIVNPERFAHFRYMIKREGGLLAKGRLLGIQFDTLFTDGLYWRLAKHANQQALRIREALREKGVAFLTESPSNQQFVLLPRAMYDTLKEDYCFEVAGEDENFVSVRICTSWATTEESVNALIHDIGKC